MDWDTSPEIAVMVMKLLFLTNSERDDLNNSSHLWDNLVSAVISDPSHVLNRQNMYVVFLALFDKISSRRRYMAKVPGAPVIRMPMFGPPGIFIGSKADEIFTNSASTSSRKYVGELCWSHLVIS